METRDVFSFPSWYPFGIEVEISNFSIYDMEEILEKDKDVFNFERVKSGKNLDGYSYSFWKNYNLLWQYKPEYTNTNLIWGMEITSPILYNQTEYLINMRKALEQLKQNGAEVNEKCSIHVHIGAKPFSRDFKKLYSFFLFYLLFEPVFYKMSAMGNFGHVRESAFKWSSPLFSQMKNTKLTQKDAKNYIFNNQNKDKKQNALHFRGFDLFNDSYGSSFEVRVFNGTLDSFVVENYIAMVLSSIYYSVGDPFSHRKMLKRCKAVMKERSEWSIFDDFVSHADPLMEEFMELVFPRQLDKDLFYEQYSGNYLKRVLH